MNEYPIEDLVVDGESEDEGMMTADGTNPPFALFSPDLQKNVGGPYAERKHAETAFEVMMQGGMIPYTSTFVIWTIGGKPSKWYDKD